jgi:hypothetical protein
MSFSPHFKLYILIFFIAQLLACKGDTSAHKSSTVKETISASDRSVADIEADKQVAELEQELVEIIKDEKLKASNEEKVVKAPVDSIAKPETPKKKPKKKRVKKEKPKITFEVSEYDFGEIIEGDTINYKFEFVNQGKVPLEILSADATCGCTRPSFPFIPIEPGDKGYIGVQYISINKEGNQKPEITVKSNGTPAVTSLLLSGFVKQKPKEEEEVQAVKLDTLVPIKSSNKGN